VALTDGIYIDAALDRISVWFPDLGLSVPVDSLGVRTDELWLSPSGTRVLARTGEAFAVWDVATGERHVLRGQDGSFLSEKWAGNDTVVTTSNDGTVRIWPLPSMAPRTPAETRAWLDSLTNFEIGDPDAREPACE
jgi:WD40 repeat protein